MKQITKSHRFPAKRNQPSAKGNDRGAKRSEQSGFVLVWVSIFMLGLIAFAGLAIDVGYWYLKAGKVQRAADAAALAGVVKLPDSSAAEAVAVESLTKNGFTRDANVEFAFNSPAANKYEVTVKEKNVATMFASFVVDKIDLSRTSQAEYRRPLAMGSPFSSIGTGPMDSSVGRQGFWNAINGYCTPREDGDLYASAFMKNKTNTRTYCAAGQGLTEKNPNYKGTGYNFLIDVPASGYKVSIFDPSFNPGALGIIDGQSAFSPDKDLGRDSNVPGAGDPTSTITTIYSLYDTKGTPDMSDDGAPVIAPATFNSAQVQNGWANQWYQINFALLGGHQYRLNVQTAANEQNSIGSNAFGLSLSGNGLQLPGGNYQRQCDSRNDPSCPRIYGLGALSIFTDESSVDNWSHEAEFYLGDVETRWAGETLNIELFDPGEGAQEMSVLLPNGQQHKFTYDTNPGGQNMSDHVGGYTLPVDGRPGAMAGRLSDYKFNDREVSLKTAVPDDYQALVAQEGGNETTWWKIRYKMHDSNDARYANEEKTDRTTWSMKLDDGSPVRLIPKSQTQSAGSGQ